ncbi:MFS transporter [Pseudoroseomonas cervicalis]|uniref:MFS transporter n=1 Tax=Teichococcus cervicalis TaxID=204525 RepID=UPI0022F1C0E2|nr:MFS transporter [Pseudoroseomonas cervicalis]WBV42227.1 MFS transporter [Pseudoroseomonas cervicalis]
MTPHAALIGAGFALTALAYGLARFAYGLLLPQIRAELDLSAGAAGWIGGGAFAAYCMGIAYASLAGARHGPRFLAVLAGLAAVAGMALVAIAHSAPMLGAAIALAGLSTGLASPPLAAAVGQRVAAPSRPRANGLINAGTAAGIILSGLAALGFSQSWRGLYTGFALLGLGVIAWLWVALPGREETAASRATLSWRALAVPGLGGLCAAALLMGASSTAIWTFGADLLRRQPGFEESGIPLAWIALGLGGLAGAGTGSLVGRFGLGRVHRAALRGLALAYLLMLALPVLPALGFAAMVLFGAAYIVSSGALLIRGTALLAERPDLGLGLPFLAIASGQMLGAPLFGMVLEAAGPGVALGLCAVLAGAAMLSGLEERA